jgi:hypothetical protein
VRGPQPLKPEPLRSDDQLHPRDHLWTWTRTWHRQRLLFLDRFHPNTQLSLFPLNGKQFKPPLLSNKTSLVNSVSASPSNAVQSKGSVPRFKPPLLSSTSTLPKPSTPSRATSDSAFRTPVRLGEVNRPSPTKKFTTPFKPGMRPGEPGRAKLQEDQEKKPLQELQKDQVFQIQMNSPPRKPVYDIPPSLNSPSGSRKGKEKAKEYHFFNLGRFNFISPLADFDG